MSLVVHTKILLNLPRLLRFALQTGGLLLLCVFAFACSDSDNDGKTKTLDGLIYESDATVVLLAVDGLDWQLVDPMIANGRLPHLAGLIKRGVIGGIHTPARGGTATHGTTVATGQLPKKHGIVDAPHADASTSETAPTAGAERKVKAFWDIFTDHGIATDAVGWPATPPETDASTKANVTEALTAVILASALETKDSDARIKKLSAACSADLLSKQLALRLLESQQPRMMTVRFSMLDVAGHQFTSNDEAEQQKIDRDYGPVQIKAYELMDRWIGEVAASAVENATIMVVSTHGLMMGSHTLHGNGVFVVAGPHVKRGGRTAEHVNLEDITPTLLWIFGLPASEEMNGRVLTEVFKKSFAEPRPALLVPTYGALAAADDATTPSLTGD